MANFFRPSTWIRRRDLETPEPTIRQRGYSPSQGAGEVATTASRRLELADASAEASASTRPAHEKIEQRAYEIWSAEGCPRGRDMEIWLAAEREILDRVLAGRAD